MNRLAARFDAHQFWKGRYELRLLPRSIYRYEPVEGTILDGAVYALVHGTNPEILILIEAHQVTGMPAQWKVSFGSLAAARCVVRIDEQEFWSCEVDQGATSDPRRFFLRHLPVEEIPAAEPPETRIKGRRKSGGWNRRTAGILSGQLQCGNASGNFAPYQVRILRCSQVDPESDQTLSKFSRP